MMLAWILFVAALIFGAIPLVRALVQRDTGSPREEPGDPSADAVRIIEERYALGDIDRDEFEERRRILRL